MKFVQKASVFGLLLSLTFDASSAFAGTERSGGNLLEAAFTNAIRQIDSEIHMLGRRAQSKLRFTVEQYSAAIFGIKVECASDAADIEYLRMKKRLAFVKNAGDLSDKTILLNCYVNSSQELVLTDDWLDVLNGISQKSALSSNAKVLITHEVFRAEGIEKKEGDYSFSSTLKNADLEQRKSLSEQVADIFFSQHPACNISIENTTLCGVPGRYLTGNFILLKAWKRFKQKREFYMADDYLTIDFLAACQTENQISASALKERILTLDTSDALVSRLVSALRGADCFDNR